MDSNPTVNEILTANDRCDQCSAQAYVKVLFDSGELLFCAHHWNRHEAVAKDQASRIIDERYRLTPKPEPVEPEEEPEELQQRRRRD